MKIRNRITLYFFIVAIFSLVCLVATSFYNVDSLIINNATNQLQMISKIQKARITELIKKNQDELRLMANRTGIIDALASYDKQPNPIDKELLSARITDAKRSIETYETVAIFDNNLTTITSTDPNFNVVNYDDFDLLKQNINVNKIHLSTNFQGDRKLILHSPIIQNNKTLGIIFIVSNIKDFEVITKDYTGFGNTGETTIAGKDINGDAIFLHPARFAKSNEVTIISKEKTDVVITQALLKNEQFFKNLIDYRGQKVFAVTGYIGEVDWGIVTKIDQAELFSPIYQHAFQISLISLILILITIIASITLSKSISKPIEELHHGTEKIETGDLNYKVGKETKDEIGQLSRSFDSMVESLKASRREVYQKVEEQTKEIVEKGKDLEDQQKAVLNILEDVDAEKQKVTLEKIRSDALIASIGDGIIATDSDGKIIVMNKVAEKLLGFSIDEAIGKSYVDVVLLEDEKGTLVPFKERPLARALDSSTTTTTTTKLFLLSKNKIKFPVAITVSSVILDNKIIGAIEVFRDITHESEVDRMKTEFISLSSHQLRTPLSAMKWFLEMLIAGDAGKLTKEQDEFVQNIYQSNERMIALVNSLLNISRIESGRIIIDPKPTNLGDLVKEVVTELQNKIKEKKENLIVSVHPQLPKINVDPQLIHEVYQNLLTNSIKYSPNGGEISIFISKKDEEIISQISDNGYGIPEKEQKKVFAKFFRAENIVKLETDGTGLGLYMVKSIIESSGGRIWFESHEGKGTSFWFALPLSGSKANKGEVMINS